LYGAKKTDTKTNETGKRKTKSTAAVEESDLAEHEDASLTSAKGSKKKKKTSKAKESVSAVEENPREQQRVKAAVLSGLGGSGMEVDDVEARIMNLKPKYVAEDDDGFGDDAGFRTNSPYQADIPTILPVPGSKERLRKAASGAAKKSAVSNNILSTDKGTSKPDSDTNVEKESILTAAQTSTLDFILQFPVFPTESLLNSQQAEEFNAMVKACKQRFLPTVNVVLNRTRSDLSSFFLQRWREKMTKELGEAGFRKHQEEVIWQGTNLHACVQQFLSGVPLDEIQIQEKIQGHWGSISPVLSDVSEIRALETNVTHPHLHYKGTFDCVAKYKNTLCIIDWKTSSKPKPLIANLYDNPLQVAAYLGALNACPDFTAKFGTVENAVIVVAYNNGELAHVHRMAPAIVRHYWQEWCQRLHQYWTLVVTEKESKETTAAANFDILS
jgi:genome maintenance exonuclease 1